jgi:hypothetical protein
MGLRPEAPIHHQHLPVLSARMRRLLLSKVLGEERHDHRHQLQEGPVPVSNAHVASAACSTSEASMSIRSTPAEIRVACSCASRRLLRHRAKTHSQSRRGLKRAQRAGRLLSFPKTGGLDCIFIDRSV